MNSRRPQPDEATPPPAAEASEACTPRAARKAAAAKASREVARGRVGRPRVPLFDADEAAALRVPPPLKPSQWAEAYRVLAEGDSDAPGPWRNDLAPYGRGIMDLLFKPGVASIAIEKASQLGVSEMIRNILGYLADQDPDPAGFVLPDKGKGRKIISERIIPLFNDTPRLAALLEGRKAAVQKEMIRLCNSFLLWLAWAGSPATTKGDPWRIGFIDELDECALAVARLGQTRDLVGAVRKRTRTYGDRARLLAVSTPLDALSEIDAQVNAARYLLEFYVPCLACGGWQPLDFSHVRFEAPDAIKADKRAWAAWVLEDLTRTTYECRYCQARWSEDQRPPIIRAGKWCSSTRVDKDGVEIGARGVDDHGKPLATDLAAGIIFDAEAVEEFPRGTTLGLRIWAAYSLLGVTLSGIAAEYIEARGDRGKMFTFTTETEGRVFEQQLARVDETVFAKKVERATLDEGIVPAWAGKLLCSIDTQIDYFIVTVRAWGEDHLSHRVWHGRIGTFDELETLLAQPWRCEDPACGPMVIELAGIDSGGTTDDGADSSRTQQVYRWGQKHKARVRVLKGFDANRTGQLIWLGKGYLVEDAPRGVRRHREIPLWCLAKHHWQGVLHDYIHAGVSGRRRDDREMWFLNRRSDPVYERELANAHQVLERSGPRPVQIWKKLHPGGRWDYRDSEVYQCVLASLARVDLLPPAEQIIATKKAMWQATLEAQKAAAAAAGGKADHSDWLNTGGKWRL
jgi:phage terminase large subunit GpA-like protein